MKSPLKALEEACYWLLFYLISVEVFIIALYLGCLIVFGQAFHPLDVEGTMTIPSLFQAFHLFLMGLISLIILKTQGESQQRPSQLFLVTMAVLLFYGAADELLKIHHHLYHWFPSLQPRQEIAGYLALFVAAPVLFYRDFLALWRSYRRETLLVLLGMAIFTLGEVSAAMLKYETLKTFLAIFFPDSEGIIVFVGKLRLSWVELTAMIGESVCLYGVLLFFIKRSLTANVPETTMLMQTTQALNSEQ